MDFIESKNKLEIQLAENKRKTENLKLLKEKKNDLKRKLERVKFELENVQTQLNNRIGAEGERKSPGKF